MARLTSGLERIGETIRTNLAAKHEARDKAIRSSREAIFKCASAIRAAHRGEFALAESLASEARAILDAVNEAIRGNEDLRHTGFVHDAEKEYAEASITLCLVSGRPVPAPDDLRVVYSAYLNGLGEAAGELRRHLLDTMRCGQMERCEEILGMMDDIYSLLVTMDFPDALTGGLKRTTDMVRGVLEKSRGDLTLAFCQRQLEMRLAAFDRKIGGG